MKKLFDQMGWSYSLVEDFFLPNLTMPEKELYFNGN
jgi:hypothetical protein